MNTNDISRDFVAVDVEYADSEQNICQVGLAVVRNLEITERRSWLIQPPGNRYEDRCMRVHHITPEMTAGAPAFGSVWPEIGPYLQDTQVWAHNASSVEQAVLAKNLARNGLDASWLGVMDSRDLYRRPGCNGGNGLEQCSLALGLPFDHGCHHDAAYDAEACARLVIAYVQGVRPDWDRAPRSGEEMRKHRQERLVLQPGQFLEHAARIEEAKKKLDRKKAEKPVAEPDLFAEEAPAAPSLTEEDERLLFHTDVLAVVTSTCEGAEPMEVDVFDIGDRRPAEGHDRVDLSRLDTSEDNPLRGAKVAITGNFHIGRKDIKAALEEMGAKETSSVAKTTAALLVGSCSVGLPKLASWEKLRHNGFVVPLVVGDVDLDRFLYGGARAFGVGEAGEPRKDLNFTVAHYRKHHLCLAYPSNTIAGRELYFPPAGFMGRQDLFCQMCGNLGAFGNWEYSGEVNLVVLPNSSVEGLQRGEKDDVIRDFEAFYNSQRSVVFDAEFVTERDILKFVRERIVRCDDDVTGTLYTAYLQSAGIDQEKDFAYGMEAARREYAREQEA